jgi:hypothetical protein
MAAETKNKRGRKTHGRPCLDDDERRTEIIGVRLTKKEKRQVEEWATAVNRTSALLCRVALFRLRIPRPVPEINREAWLKLAPVAGSLTSIVAMMKTGRPVGLNAEKVEELILALKKLRHALLEGE